MIKKDPLGDFHFYTNLCHFMFISYFNH